MTHVVAEPCIDCRDTECVTVCPVDCFREGEQMLFIHPEECIDCEACVPVCPSNAIFHECQLPTDWVPFKDLNAAMARQLPPIKERRKPLPVAG